jgi:hypothetical protein
MMFAIFAYVMWVPVLAGLLALGVVLIRRGVSAPEWMRRGACCGGCGYELTALGEGRCPECGAALVKVGVSTPRMALRLRGSMFLLVMGWTLSAAAGSVPVLGVIGWMGTMSQMNRLMGTTGIGVTGPSTMSCSLDPNPSENRLSAVDVDSQQYSIEFAADMITDADDSVVSGTLRLEFVSTPTPAIVDVTLPDMTWVMTDLSGEVLREGAAFGTGDTMAIYGAAGLDVSKESTIEELAYLSSAVADFVYSPEWESFGLFVAESPLVASNRVADWTASGVAQSTAMWSGGTTTWFGVWEIAMLVGVVVVAAVYIIGLVFFVRKRLKLIGQPVLA